MCNGDKPFCERKDPTLMGYRMLREMKLLPVVLRESVV